MFWDRVAGVYDLFGNVYNGRVNRKLCKIVAEEVRSDNQDRRRGGGTVAMVRQNQDRVQRLNQKAYSY